MNILDEIVANRKAEIAANKKFWPTKSLEQTAMFYRHTVSLQKSIRMMNSTGIIAEFKRNSPSKGIINSTAAVDSVTTAYAQAGASGISVLTDQKYFGGSNDDLKIARSANVCPILRKDFTVDEYQIIEAKSIGADAILLIAAILTPKQISAFTELAHSLGLEVLLEVHNESELEKNLESEVDLIGVNNRNLKTFEVSIDTSKRLAELIPPAIIRVSESGISSVDTIIELREFGFEGFLIGENFMKASSPERAAKEFMSLLQNKRAGR